METCLDFVQRNLVGSKEFMQEKIIKVTGGGAYKYKDLLCSKLGVQYVNNISMINLLNFCCSTLACSA